jgi:hypothetical protein
MALGFLLCLALLGSYYCGSMSPTNANASSMDSSDHAVVGGVWNGTLVFAVVNKETGKISHSGRQSFFF